MRWNPPGRALAVHQRLTRPDPTVLSEDRARLSRCAADANGTLHWWCGDAARTPVCEAGPAGHFLQYPAASAIGVVGVAGTVMVANNGTSGAVGMMTQTSVTPTAAAAAATACGAAVRREAAARHTAVKVAVAMGVLLAVVVGCLGMLLWMERRRRRVAREAKPSPTSSSGSLMVEEAAVANTQRSVPRLAADGGGERPRGRLSVVEEAAEETSSPSRRLRRTSKFREERSPDPIGRAV